MMRSALALGIAMTLAAAPALAQGSEKKTGSKSTISKSALADMLTANEKSLLDSFAKHDARAFFAAVAPGAWMVDETGGAGIDEMRTNWAEMKVESLTPSDMKVVPVDATAGIVTYRIEQKGTYAGQAFPPVVYATTVWVNRSGKWVAVFHQESTAAPKK